MGVGTWVGSGDGVSVGDIVGSKEMVISVLVDAADVVSVGTSSGNALRLILIKKTVSIKKITETRL